MDSNSSPNTKSHDAGAPPVSNWWTALYPEFRIYALLALGYLALAALFTQPLIFHAGDQTAVADLSSDQYQTIWSFWWLKKALFELGQNPYWTNVIYHPHGTGLGYHLSPFTGLCAIAVATVTGIAINTPLTFNILLFGSFVVTGLATFALARQVTGSVPAAIAASIIVVVSPYRLWHLNHLNLLSIGWGIAAIHFALRYLRHAHWRTMVAALFFWGAAFYSSLTVASFVMLFVCVYALMQSREIWRHPHRVRLIRGLAIGIILAGVVSAWGLWELRQTGSTWNIGWPDTVERSANLQSLIMPTHARSLAAQMLGNAGSFAPWLGSSAFLGWLLPIGVLLTAWFGRRRVSPLWLILAGIFLLLACGPTLKVGDSRFLEGLLPYRWLFEFVPYLNLSRAPIRLATVAHLCLAIYAAQGLALAWPLLRGKLQNAKSAVTVASLGVSLLVGILFVENTQGVTAITPLPTPSVYRDVKHRTAIEAIVEGPIMRASQICNLYMYFQTIHEKNVANGYLTHPSPSSRQLLDQLTDGRELSPRDRALLARAGIDVAVFHDANGDGTLIPLR
jgi:hypothetical protein